MTKKLSSIIIILFTILYVTISLYLNGYNVMKIGNIKARQVINNIKNINIESVLKYSKNTKTQYEEVKQNSEVIVKNNIEPVDKIYKLNIMKMSKETKKAKLAYMNSSERELIKILLDRKPIDEYLVAKEISKENKDSNSRQDDKSLDNSKTGNKEFVSQPDDSESTAVFNVEPKYQLTEADKERILTASKKLSPLDQEKINTYIKYINDENAKNAVNLLRDRLSDKDFEDIKDISLKLNKK